jgi:lipid A ethanolaminephosphotransferase
MNNILKSMGKLFRHEKNAILVTTVFVMLTANFALFQHIVAIYPLSLHNAAFLGSLALFFSIVTYLFFLWISAGKIGKWLVAIWLIAGASAAYFMDTFGVLIDTVMIENILQTSTKEAAGLLSLNMGLRVVLLGVIPAWLVLRYWPTDKQNRINFITRGKITGLLIFTMIAICWLFFSGYSTFIREHKIARFYANPIYPFYSVIKYGFSLIPSAKQGPLKKIAQDAKLIDSPEKHELIIFVVGETARADRFSLNGYGRETNPMLAKENVISLKNVTSCGTSTAVSVPCMFSSLGRKGYDKEKALAQENALDVLSKNGIQVLWRDNNSDSKGVATRIEYEDYKSPTHNTVCDSGECRDIGMLVGLDEYIGKHQNKDILIVLHQMGNHGPEYYRRYPKEFEKFKPLCMTGELRDCTQQEVDNSYDNAILYTDYFLANVIQFLKKYDARYETAMLYVSDHGESLGEHGIYLHAAPYAIAPKEQTHVPAIVWMGKHFDYQLSQLKPYEHYPLSHDDVFCSLLVAYELQSATCRAKDPVLMENQDISAMQQAAK